MSASDPNSAIYVTDSVKDIKNKVFLTYLEELAGSCMGHSCFSLFLCLCHCMVLQSSMCMLVASSFSLFF